MAAFVAQVAAALATGNTVVVWHSDAHLAADAAKVLQQAGLPEGALAVLRPGGDASLAELIADPRVAGVAFAGPRGLAHAINRWLAGSEGPIRPLVLFAEGQAATQDQGETRDQGEARDRDQGETKGAGFGSPLSSGPHYLHRFAHERTLSVDTTASGGNALLLSLG